MYVCRQDNRGVLIYLEIHFSDLSFPPVFLSRLIHALQRGFMRSAHRISEELNAQRKIFHCLSGLLPSL